MRPAQNILQLRALWWSNGSIKKFLRTILKILAGLVLLLLAAVVFLLVRPTTIHFGGLRDPIERQLGKLLGREVSIGGDIMIVTGTSPKIRVEKLSVSNPDGWDGGGRLAELAKFETQIGLPELIRKKIDIDDIEVEGLTLALEIDAGGRGNWEGLIGSGSVDEVAAVDGAGTEPTPAKAEPEPEKTADEDGDIAFKLTGLGSLEISDLSVTRQEAGGELDQIIGIKQLTGSAPEGEDMQLALVGQVRQLDLEGNLKAGSLQQLFAGAAEWPWSFDGTVGGSTLKVDSQVAAADFSTPGVTTFELLIPDSRELEVITGPIPNFGVINLAGEVSREAVGRFSLPSIEGKFGESPIEAVINLDLTKRLPSITGEIELAFLDAEALRVEESEEDGRERNEAGEAEPSDQSGGGAVASSDQPAGDEIPEREFVLPVEGTFQLKIGEITNASTTVRNLQLGLEATEHAATATVGVEFAGIDLTGELELEKQLGQNAQLAASLNGEGGDLSELIRFYSGDDRFSGKFEQLQVTLAGEGRSALEAWSNRGADLEINQAGLTYKGKDKDWKFIVAKADSSRKPGQEAKFLATGVIGEAPWELQFTTQELQVGEALKFNIVTGKVADLAFQLDPVRPEGQPDAKSDGIKFSLEGGRLDNLNPIYELDLPPLGPYSVAGQIKLLEEGVNLDDFTLEIGDSEIAGTLKIDQTREQPVIDLVLNSDVIQLDDFRFDDWSAVDGKKSAGAPAPKKPAVDEGSKEGDEGGAEKPSPGITAATMPAILSHEVLSKLDATIKIELGKLLVGKDSLGAAKADISLVDGRFELKKLSTKPLNGNLDVSVLFHPQAGGSLDWNASMKATNLDFGVIARAINPESENGGVINIDMGVGAKNVPFGKMHLTQATGKLDFDFCPTNLEAGILDLWATNIVVAILPKLDSENQSVVNCVIGRCVLEDGVITPESLGLDTTKIRVGTVGTINLKEDAIDLTLTPVPKRAQLLSLEVPVRIQGTLREPKIEMGSLPVVSTIARMTKNTVLFPVKTIAGDRLPEDGSDVCPCKAGYNPVKPGEGEQPDKEETEKEEEGEEPKRRGLFDGKPGLFDGKPGLFDKD